MHNVKFVLGMRRVKGLINYEKEAENTTMVYVATKKSAQQDTRYHDMLTAMAGVGKK